MRKKARTVQNSVGAQITEVGNRDLSFVIGLNDCKQYIFYLLPSNTTVYLSKNYTFMRCDPLKMRQGI